MPRIKKNVLGKMKDKLHGDVKRETVDLRSDMYAIHVEGDAQEDKKLVTKKCKGVRMLVVDHDNGSYNMSSVP